MNIKKMLFIFTLVKFYVKIMLNRQFNNCFIFLYVSFRLFQKIILTIQIVFRDIYHKYCFNYEWIIDRIYYILGTWRYEDE